IVVILVLGVVSLFAPVISSEILKVDYIKTSRDTFLRMGSEGHLLGTDDIGRDYFARLLYGGRVSLGIAVTSAIFSLVIGVSVGLVAGFFHGSRIRIWRLRIDLDSYMIWFITTLNS